MITSKVGGSWVFFLHWARPPWEEEYLMSLEGLHLSLCFGPIDWRRLTAPEPSIHSSFQSFSFTVTLYHAHACIVYLLTEHSKVLVAGLPLDQKVVQYGPFVLNTQEEVYQAMMDFQTHSNGFERAKGWQSEIGKSMVHWTWALPWRWERCAMTEGIGAWGRLMYDHERRSGKMDEWRVWNWLWGMSQRVMY